MKIESIYTKEIIDTDKMNPIDAEFTERQQELVELAMRYDIPFFCISLLNERSLSSQHFINQNGPKAQQKAQEIMKRFISTINYILEQYRNSGHKVSLINYEN